MSYSDRLPRDSGYLPTPSTVENSIHGQGNAELTADSSPLAQRARAQGGPISRLHHAPRPQQAVLVDPASSNSNIAVRNAAPPSNASADRQPAPSLSPVPLNGASVPSNNAAPFANPAPVLPGQRLRAVEVLVTPLRAYFQATAGPPPSNQQGAQEEAILDRLDALRQAWSEVCDDLGDFTEPSAAPALMRLCHTALTSTPLQDASDTAIDREAAAALLSDAIHRVVNIAEPINPFDFVSFLQTLHATTLDLHAESQGLQTPAHVEDLAQRSLNAPNRDALPLAFAAYARSDLNWGWRGPQFADMVGNGITNHLAELVRDRPQEVPSYVELCLACDVPPVFLGRAIVAVTNSDIQRLAGIVGALDPSFEGGSLSDLAAKFADEAGNALTEYKPKAFDAHFRETIVGLQLRPMSPAAIRHASALNQLVPLERQISLLTQEFERLLSDCPDQVGALLLGCRAAGFSETLIAGALLTAVDDTLEGMLQRLADIPGLTDVLASSSDMRGVALAAAVHLNQLGQGGFQSFVDSLVDQSTQGPGLVPTNLRRIVRLLDPSIDGRIRKGVADRLAVLAQNEPQAVLEYLNQWASSDDAADLLSLPLAPVARGDLEAFCTAIASNPELVRQIESDGDLRSIMHAIGASLRGQNEQNFDATLDRLLTTDQANASDGMRMVGMAYALGTAASPALERHIQEAANNTPRLFAPLICTLAERDADPGWLGESIAAAVGFNPERLNNLLPDVMGLLGPHDAALDIEERTWNCVRERADPTVFDTYVSKVVGRIVNTADSLRTIDDLAPLLYFAPESVQPAIASVLRQCVKKHPERLPKMIERLLDADVSVREVARGLESAVAGDSYRLCRRIASVEGLTRIMQLTPRVNEVMAALGTVFTEDHPDDLAKSLNRILKESEEDEGLPGLSAWSLLGKQAAEAALLTRLFDNGGPRESVATIGNRWTRLRRNQALHGRAEQDLMKAVLGHVTSADAGEPEGYLEQLRINLVFSCEGKLQSEPRNKSLVKWLMMYASVVDLIDDADQQLAEGTQLLQGIAELNLNATEQASLLSIMRETANQFRLNQTKLKDGKLTTYHETSYESSAVLRHMIAQLQQDCWEQIQQTHQASPDPNLAYAETLGDAVRCGNGNMNVPQKQRVRATDGTEKVLVYKRALNVSNQATLGVDTAVSPETENILFCSNLGKIFERLIFLQTRKRFNPAVNAELQEHTFSIFDKDGKHSAKESNATKAIVMPEIDGEELEVFYRNHGNTNDLDGVINNRESMAWQHVFDFLTLQTDRNGGNAIVTPDGTVNIDNGGAALGPVSIDPSQGFGTLAPLSKMILSVEQAQVVLNLTTDDIDTAAQGLGLSWESVDACKQRLNWLQEAARYALGGDQTGPSKDWGVTIVQSFNSQEFGEAFIKQCRDMCDGLEPQHASIVNKFLTYLDTVDPEVFSNSGVAGNQFDALHEFGQQVSAVQCVLPYDKRGPNPYQPTQMVFREPSAYRRFNKPLSAPTQPVAAGPSPLHGPVTKPINGSTSPGTSVAAMGFPSELHPTSAPLNKKIDAKPTPVSDQL